MQKKQEQEPKCDEHNQRANTVFVIRSAADCVLPCCYCSWRSQRDGTEK